MPWAPAPCPGLSWFVVVAAGWPDVWLVAVASIALLVLTALGAVYAWHLRAKSLEHKHRRKMFEVRGGEGGVNAERPATATTRPGRGVTLDGTNGSLPLLPGRAFKYHSAKL